MRGKDGGGCMEYGFAKPGRLRWTCGGQEPDAAVAETREKTSRANNRSFECILPAIYPCHKYNFFYFQGLKEREHLSPSA